MSEPNLPKSIEVGEQVVIRAGGAKGLRGVVRGVDRAGLITVEIAGRGEWAYGPSHLERAFSTEQPADERCECELGLRTPLNCWSCSGPVASSAKTEAHNGE